MKVRILLVVGTVLVATQSLTAFADMSGMPDMNSFSSSMMTSSIQSSIMSSIPNMNEDADLTSDEFYVAGAKCNCTWIREVTVEATSEAVARALAIEVPPKRDEDVVTSCVKQGDTNMYKCTITRMTSKDAGPKQCEAYKVSMNKQYVPVPYKSIMCVHVAV